MLAGRKGRVDLIVNRNARGAPKEDRLAAASRALRVRGWHVHLVYTEAPLHATDLAREAVDAGAEYVIACGGDGTINEVLPPLIHSPTALSVIRGGTANIWASEAGFPRDPVAAALAIETAPTIQGDLGLADRRPFLLMAGIGFDAHVAAAVPGWAKRRLGALAYVLQAAREVFRYRRSRVAFRLDGREEEMYALLIILGNTRLYGGIVEITRRARADDGLLDFCGLDGQGPLQMLHRLLAIRRGRHLAAPWARYRQASEVDLLTEGLPVQVDGEPAGATPMTFRVLPGAVRLVVPGLARSPLFAASAPSRAGPS